MTRHLFIATALLCLPAAAWAQGDNQKLAGEARQVLEKYCYDCHGKNGAGEAGFNYVLDLPTLLQKKRVVPNNLDKSKIWVRASSTDADAMPPPDYKKPVAKADLDVLKAWIEAGCPPFPAVAVAEAKRPWLDEKYVYKAMFDYLQYANETDSAKFQRFFTLTNLHNNPKVKDSDMRQYRAGVAKLLNSLSWRKNIVYPKAIDQWGVVLAFDLRDLDWDLNYQWEKLIGRSNGKGDNAYAGYPYGLTHERYPEDPQLNVMAKSVYNYTHTRIPAVRADWFLYNASVPPLYHELANIPTTTDYLEKRLQVNVRSNFLRETLARGGFFPSGVSKNNRLVERHHGLFGCYWKSYDFKENDGDGNLFAKPLGPANLFPHGKHPYPFQAFVHAGGEMIWALPNGLHAYMLTDGNGKRINEGPTEVVRDKDETAGRGPAVVNGLSCMKCHSTGMIDFKDHIRDAAGVQGAAKEKVKRLFPSEKAMAHLIEMDREDFLAAVDRVISPYVRVGADAKKDIAEFMIKEPVSYLASGYIKNTVTVDDAARELGLQDPKELMFTIKSNPRLRDELALRVWSLPNGGGLNRQAWETVLNLVSPYQEAAQQLGRGEPISVRRDYYDDQP